MMEIYSPNVELKEKFGKEIRNAEYISACSKICEKSNIAYEEARFIPHNLLTNWNEIADFELYGDEDSEDFDLDFRREILFELENDKSLNCFIEHKTFKAILYSIDSKLKDRTFIPLELKNIDKWWQCIVFKKGTKKYISQTEENIFYKYGIHLNLATKVEEL
ncbi:MAG: hypothetical protein IR153_04780 [Flavobacterium sp.]|nr:hypothetical protein [Flavobacterium sp.]